MSEFLKIALIGCGEHSREVLIPCLSALANVSVVSVCDSDRGAAESAARILRASRVDADFANVLQSGDIQAVVIAATPQVHYQAARLALANGLHVFVEKPPTVTTKELSVLAREAKEKNLVTCVGHNLRHTSAALEMRKLLGGANKHLQEVESFGRPVAMEMRYLASKPRGDRWGLESPLRSFLLSHANHAIDFMVFHMGRVKRVNAALAANNGDGIVLSAQLVFESGAVGNLLATSLAPHFSISGSILSETSRVIQLNSLNEIVGFGFQDTGKRWGYCWTGRTLLSGYEASGYFTELQAFTDAAMGKQLQKCEPSFGDEIVVYEALDEIERIIEGSAN